MSDPNMSKEVSQQEQISGGDTEESPSNVHILQNIVLTSGDSNNPEDVSAELGTTIDEELISPSSSMQTGKRLSSNSTRKLKRTIKLQNNSILQLQRQNIALKRKLHLLTGNIASYVSLNQYQTLTRKFCHSVPLGKFINMQVAQAQKCPKGRRYTLELKKECVELYFSCPRLYKNILRKRFCLPCPSTLLNLTQNFTINPGLDNQQLFEMLEVKVKNFSKENRLCVLCVDEMSVKSNLFYSIGTDEVVGFESNGRDRKVFQPARTVTTLMIRGIYSRWSQPAIGILFLQIGMSCRYVEKYYF